MDKGHEQIFFQEIPERLLLSLPPFPGDSTVFVRPTPPSLHHSALPLFLVDSKDPYSRPSFSLSCRLSQFPPQLIPIPFCQSPIPRNTFYPGPPVATPIRDSEVLYHTLQRIRDATENKE